MVNVGLDRFSCLLIWCLVLVMLFIALNMIKKRGAVFNVLLVLVLILALFAGGKVIDLNVLSDEQREKIQEVVNRVGDAGSYITVDSGKIYVLVDDEWLNVDGIEEVNRVAGDIVINYGGEEIYLGHSGVYNTLQVLKDVGLIGGKK